MKFANYKFCTKGVNNLGDNMQIIAIDEIYRMMGIASEDIVYIDTQELDSYDGEYVVLPVSMPLVDYRENGIAGRFSERIVPVFLGLTMVKDTLQPQEVAYYKKYEPIGCRDERTLNTLRKYQIDCYLHGCFTVTLPWRKEGPAQNKVFIVDVAKKYHEIIPPQLRENACMRTHMRTDHLDDPKLETQRQYEEYKENASLVITSLLHCAVPCLAAGIPVVMMKEAVSYRMAWLEKLLPIYTPEDFHEIDWRPQARLTQEHKQRVLALTIRRLQQAKEKYEEVLDLSFYYEDRVKHAYRNDACYTLKNYIDTNWKDKDAPYRYAVWGLTQISEWVVDYITGHYPNAKLMHAYDSYRKVKFYGLTSESPENIRAHAEETVFITTNGAEKAARELFAEIGKKENTYAFMQVVK